MFEDIDGFRIKERLVYKLCCGIFERGDNVVYYGMKYGS